VIPLSVLHQIGLDDFTRALAQKLPMVKADKEDVDLRIALSGRRNVGKSSLTNHLCGAKRVIVSDMAGTTRDAVDVQLTWRDLKVTLVDTAGLRKKNQTEDSIEFFSVNRTFGALYRSEIGLLMVDVVQGISQVDQKLGRWFAEHHKPCIIVVNKWDLADEEITKDEYDRYLADRLPGLSYAPVVYTSVQDGVGLDRLYDVIHEMRAQMRMEFSTNQINDALQEAQQRKRPKSYKGALPKLFYGTQIKKSPPTFLIFGKCTQGVDGLYCRYLSHFFRKSLRIPYLPVNFVFRNRTSMYKS
jgi:GTP-binding protein